jgi:hypothetical protein
MSRLRKMSPNTWNRIMIHTKNRKNQSIDMKMLNSG